MTWQEKHTNKIVSMEEAARQIKSGDFIGVGLALGSASPAMLDAILNRWKELTDVTICDSVPVRPCKLYDLKFMASIDGHVNYRPCFGMMASRKINESRLPDFFPLMSSDGGDRYAKWSDVFICQVTPPNAKGFVNLGLTNFYQMDAIRLGKASGKLRLAIGEVNDQMPVIFGDNWMHASEFDLFVENSAKIPAVKRPEPGEKEKIIGQHVLDLINDGDTIQMGFGTIPEAVVAGLEGKHDLGVLTELFPAGLNELVPKGIITNARKPYHKGKTIATFCIGDQDLYDFAAENPECEFFPASHTNDPSFIASHPNMVAMNMAVMMDFSGQIASEGIGHRMISGSGGQLDFMIGSFYSKGGKGITLM